MRATAGVRLGAGRTHAVERTPEGLRIYEPKPEGATALFGTVMGVLAGIAFFAFGAAAAIFRGEFGDPPAWLIFLFSGGFCAIGLALVWMALAGGRSEFVLDRAARTVGRRFFDRKGRETKRREWTFDRIDRVITHIGSIGLAPSDPDFERSHVMLGRRGSWTKSMTVCWGEAEEVRAIAALLEEELADAGVVSRRR